MIDNSVIHQILAIADEKNGRDNALNGFEFQVSSAKKLIDIKLRVLAII